MKIAVISDTHLRGTKFPEHIAELLTGSDMIIHAGDILELPIIDELRSIARVVAVRGNMDSAEVRRELPSRQVIELAGFKIGVTHGQGAPSGIVERVRTEFGDVDCIIFGHTHQPLVLEKEGILFFNPGSPTDRIFAKRNTIGFLHVGDVIRPEIVEIKGGDNPGLWRKVFGK